MSRLHSISIRASLIAFWLTATPVIALADTGTEAGNSLAQAVFDRAAGTDLTTLSRMELREKGRPLRQRELVSYRLKTGRGESVHLLRFLDPQDIAGTGLLSHDKADGSNEQWLYLPELDRVRRIGTDRKGGRFVGSDLYFEDLQQRLPARDRHALQRTEIFAGVTCDVLVSVPLEPSGSVYSKRISWIDKQTLLVLRVDYFEHNENSPSKRWELLAKKLIQRYWTVMESRMSDLTTGHETRLIVESAVYDRKLPLKLFTPQALADESLESEYRP